MDRILSGRDNNKYKKKKKLKFWFQFFFFYFLLINFNANLIFQIIKIGKAKNNINGIRKLNSKEIIRRTFKGKQ